MVVSKSNKHSILVILVMGMCSIVSLNFYRRWDISRDLDVVRFQLLKCNVVFESCYSGIKSCVDQNNQHRKEAEDLKEKVKQNENYMVNIENEKEMYECIDGDDTKINLNRTKEKLLELKTELHGNTSSLRDARNWNQKLFGIIWSNSTDKEETFRGGIVRKTISEVNRLKTEVKLLRKQFLQLRKGMNFTRTELN